MAQQKKSNAARLLDRLGISYELTSYPVDPEDLSAVHAAEALGANPSQVFKTLVTRGYPHGIAMAVIPGNAELDLKKFASVFGNKHTEMIQQKELLPLTGYVRGGCSPLAAKKEYPVCIDESALNFDRIYVSAGQRGLQLLLSPYDLKLATKAVFASIVFKKS